MAARGKDGSGKAAKKRPDPEGLKLIEAGDAAMAAAYRNDCACRKRSSAASMLLCGSNPWRLRIGFALCCHLRRRGLSLRRSQIHSTLAEQPLK